MPAKQSAKLSGNLVGPSAQSLPLEAKPFLEIHMQMSPIAGLGLAVLITITLSGCEVAEESALKLQEKAEKAAQELARESLSDTVQTFNKHVDEAQQAAEELLGREEDKEGEGDPDWEDGAQSDLRDSGIET